MPQTRHLHSHSRSGHGGPSAGGAFGAHSRTSSSTSLVSTKRSGAAVAAAGLGFTQVVPGGKKRPDSRPHVPHRNVSNESDQSQGRTRGKHAPSQSQSTISSQSLQASVVGATQSQAQSQHRNKSNRGNSQGPSQAQLLDRANQANGEEDEDEWVSSSGAVTPNSSATEGEEEHETESDRVSRRAMLIRSSLQTHSRERQSRERDRDVTAGTPKATENNVFTANHHHGYTNGNRKQAHPSLPQLERSDTQQTVQVSSLQGRQDQEEIEEEEEVRIPITAVPSVITIPSGAVERPSSPPPARSQPEPSRVPTSPHPTRSKAKTRPPSIRSIKSSSHHQYAQPHPLIRGSSFHAAYSESPQTPGPLTGTLPPLTSIKAPPVVTSSHTSGVHVESPTEIASTIGLASPTSTRGTSRSARRVSQSSIASVATLAAPSVKRASFALPTEPSSMESSTATYREHDANRDRKASTASTASLAALSRLARQPAHGHGSAAPPNTGLNNSTRSTWHFPSLPSLGFPSTPAPTRPSTPPPLALKLPPQRYPDDTVHEGGSRYRNYLRHKHAQQDSEPDEDEVLDLEPEEEEEGIGEWIPQPYFAQHLTSIRWVVRPNTSQPTTGGKPIASIRGANERGVLRQSCRRVRLAKAGVELAAY